MTAWLIEAGPMMWVELAVLALQLVIAAGMVSWLFRHRRVVSGERRAAKASASAIASASVEDSAPVGTGAPSIEDFERATSLENARRQAARPFRTNGEQMKVEDLMVWPDGSDRADEIEAFRERMRWRKEFGN